MDNRSQVRKARKQGGYDGRIRKYYPSSRRDRRELERLEKKKVKKKNRGPL